MNKGNVIIIIVIITIIIVITVNVIFIVVVIVIVIAIVIVISTSSSLSYKCCRIIIYDILVLLRVILSLNIRVQTMDFGRQRRFLLDGEDQPEKVGWRKESYFLEFINDDVARDFVGVVFNILLDGAKGTHNHWNCGCFEPPHLLKPRFPSLCIYFLIFSVDLTEVLVSRGIVMSMRRQVYNHSCSLAQCRPISRYGPVSVDGHVPQNGDSLGFMSIPSFLHLNAKLVAERPVHVCNCLVVAVDVQPETRLSMVSSKRPHFGSMSGFLRLLNCVSTSVLGGFNLGLRW